MNIRETMRAIPPSRFPISDLKGASPLKAGTALVIVLAFLIVIVSLGVSLITATMLERSSASATVASSDTLLLSETTLALVQHQIRDSTTQGPVRAWASQPGMIRVFDPSGALDRGFKLYSASNMTTTDIAAALQEDFPPANWAEQPASWVDINAPVVTREGGTQSITYPIADPEALNKVEGFDVNNAPGATDEQRLPMPVRWLYVLKNGEIVAPVETENSNEVNILGASAENPIVGRIAFWTDDESCKLNINTAAGGSPWMTPLSGGHGALGLGLWEDIDAAMKQPVQHEYQRYPGHPATTSLAPVMGAYFGLAGNALREAILDFTPRYLPGGSQGGTVFSSQSLGKAGGSLFASVDEMVFHSENFGTERPLYNGNRINKQMVNEARFFLTASSNAPEVNLFSLPRVSIWPVSSVVSPTRRTPYDNVNLRCSTIGSPPAEQVFAFTRSTPHSTLADFTGRNRQLYEYLQDLTGRSVPGFGPATFLGKYNADRDQILTAIYDYIRISNASDNSTEDPAFEPFTIRPIQGSLGQMPTQVSTPGAGQVVPFKHPDNGTQGAGRFQTVSEAAVVFSAEAVVGELRENDVVIDENAMLPSLVNLSGDEQPREMHLQSTTMRAIFVTETVTVALGFGAYDGGLEMQIEGLDSFRFRPTGGDTWLPLGFPEFAVNVIPATTLTARHNHNPLGGTNGILHTLRYPQEGLGTGLPKRLGDNDPVTGYPFFGSAVSVPLPEATQAVAINIPANMGGEVSMGEFGIGESFGSGFFDFSGGELIIVIRAGGTTIQTIRMKFPEALGLPVPVPAGHWQPNRPLASGGTSRDVFFAWPRPGAGDFLMSNWVYNATTNPRPRPGWNQSNITWYLIHYLDTVRSMQFAHGEYRHAAYLPEIALPPDPEDPPHNPEDPPPDPEDNPFAPHFVPHADYHSDRPHAHGLTYGGFNPGNYGRENKVAARKPSFGSLIAGVPQPSSSSPLSNIPVGMNGVENVFGRPGDFDNGIASHPCGAWINKPDEGDMTDAGNPSSSHPPYYGNVHSVVTGTSNFSPNRILPSPVMFGSLPTGVQRGRPWQTLLFCPNPSAVAESTHFFNPNVHEGFRAPRDHLLLDLFWMPTVEPYAISDPFSTSGKVNMNYQIFPFTYITRDTAMRGALESVRVTAIPTTQANRYKDRRLGSQSNNNYRYAINPTATLAAFEQKFADNEIFISATEICDIFLIPQQGTNNALQTAGLNQNNIHTFWNQARLTGDNSREAPYAHLYPRLTTKSNTYSIHYRVEALKKGPDGDPSLWREGRDTVVGERRGTFILERYIDPNDPDLRLPQNNFTNAVATADEAGFADIPTLDDFYQFRVLQNRQLLR